MLDSVPAVSPEEAAGVVVDAAGVVVDAAGVVVAPELLEPEEGVVEVLAGVLEVPLVAASPVPEDTAGVVVVAAGALSEDPELAGIAALVLFEAEGAAVAVEFVMLEAAGVDAELTASGSTYP